MAEYYAQRAGAGLIITEGTFVSERGQGWYGAPGVYTAEQAAGWQRVTDAVHKAGGLIFVQLWHSFGTFPWFSARVRVSGAMTMRFLSRRSPSE
jgi:2,4-dienoyl-CoA reductase-like NADH-dependent reductase (Old Yellow Enzyme family)